jgi:hypothetical protein
LDCGDEHPAFEDGAVSDFETLDEVAVTAEVLFPGETVGCADELDVVVDEWHRQVEKSHLFDRGWLAVVLVFVAGFESS